MAAPMCPKNPSRPPTSVPGGSRRHSNALPPVASTIPHPGPSTNASPSLSIPSPSLSSLHAGVLQNCSRTAPEFAPELLQVCSRRGLAELGTCCRGCPWGADRVRQASNGNFGKQWPAWLDYSAVNWPSRSGALHPLPSQPRSGLDLLLAAHSSCVNYRYRGSPRRRRRTRPSSAAGQSASKNRQPPAGLVSVIL